MSGRDKKVGGKILKHIFSINILAHFTGAENIFLLLDGYGYVSEMSQVYSELSTKIRAETRANMKKIMGGVGLQNSSNYSKIRQFCLTNDHMS